MNETFLILEKAISKNRIEHFLKIANNDPDFAYKKYLENLDICTKLYKKFHWLEIILRNSQNAALIEKYGESWFESSKINFGELEKRKIEESIRNIKNEKKIINNSSLISNLTFGFWVYLLGSKYEDLWRHCTRKGFLVKNLKRKTIFQELHFLLKIRNRIAHYETIIEKYNHEQICQKIDLIIGFIDGDYKKLNI